MFQWVKHIRQYGTLQQYSAERHEPALKMNLKDGWNASNHNLNYLPQVLTIQHHILYFQITELNLQALTPSWENCSSSCNVLPSGAELAAPLSSQTYSKPEFIGPQNRRDEKLPEDLIKDFRTLLDNTQDATHRVTIYKGTLEFIKHKSCEKMYISDKQLHTMELCIYHGIKVQFEDLEGERISQVCQWTGSLSWRRQNQWNDWVWVKQHPRRCYSALNCRLLWQLQWLFEIKLLDDDGPFVEYWLALALITIPENSGNLAPVSKFVPVRNTLAAIAL